VNLLRANAIELVVSREDARVGAAVMATLADLGHERLFGFAQARPSLDDVYLEATGKKIEDADNQAKGLRDKKQEQKESMI
jgi:ABC-2 type transport system ATP-binding protein